jgi:hypothetical protein
MLSFKRSPRFILAALAVPAALAISACGGSSTTTISAAPPATSGASTTTGAATTTSTSASAAKQAFETALKQNLLNQQHLSAAQANCVVQKLDKAVSEAEIQQVVQGNFPKSLANEAAQAGGSCALAHP